jgi:hypothetical protein
MNEQPALPLPLPLPLPLQLPAQLVEVRARIV